MHGCDTGTWTGDDFMAALDEALLRIVDGPLRWPTDLHGARRVLLRRFPFTVIYRADADRVVVVAIAHQKRRPGYWSRRGPRP